MKDSLKQRLIQQSLLAGLILGAWLGIAGDAQAQECRVDASGINFGAFNPLANQHLDVDGEFRVVCNNPSQPSRQVRVCIGLREGSAGFSINDRRMQSGANMLQYQLYQDANRTQLWGEITTNGNQYLSITAQLPANSDFIVIANPILYGRIFSGQQSVSPGSYGSKFVFPGHMELSYAFGALSLLACGSGNYPSSAFTDFGIEASVPDRCEITGGPLPLDFGTVSGLNVPNTTAITRVDVRCTKGTVYDVALDDGMFSPAPGQRRMQNASNANHYIDYDIYSDSSMSNRWGSLAAGEDHQDGPEIGTGVDSQAFLGYGLVPAQTAPSVGTYRDRVILTVHY